MRITPYVTTLLTAVVTCSTSVDAAAMQQLGFSAPLTPAEPLLSWLSSMVSNGLSSLIGLSPFLTSNAGPLGYFEVDDLKDKTIWQVIQENEHLSDLKRVLKYSGNDTKNLLDDKSKKLTFLAPVNWHHHDKKDGSDSAQVAFWWSSVQWQMDELEGFVSGTMESEDDKKRHEHRRAALAFLIDATIKYHVIDSHKPLKSWDITQNSSVATLLTIGHGKARKVLGNLLEGEPFRLRVGKSLIPKPSLYFNFYSRLVYPDVEIGGSIIHAISFPLLIPTSALQTLFFAQSEFSTFTSALQKVQADKYLKLPINRTALHDHSHTSKAETITSLASSFGMQTEYHGYNHHKHETHSPEHAHGVPTLTAFSPANLAWGRLPWQLKFYLFSPFGYHTLQRVLALHSLPRTAFFADDVYGLQAKSVEHHANVDALHLTKAWNWSEKPMGAINVTKYTFDTACPKFHYNETFIGHDEKMKFEEVDVEVFRFFVLPGNKGPLQTRVSVQGVPVLFQDIPASNGALHQIEKFIMPKGHPKEGLWSQVAEEAEKFGFGKADLEAIDF